MDKDIIIFDSVKEKSQELEMIKDALGGRIYVPLKNVIEKLSSKAVVSATSVDWAFGNAHEYSVGFDIHLDALLDIKESSEFLLRLSKIFSEDVEYSMEFTETTLDPYPSIITVYTDRIIYPLLVRYSEMDKDALNLFLELL